MEKDCLFCKIIRGETPAEMVYRDDTVVAFRDKYPSAPEHILLVPTKHIRSINELSEEDGPVISQLFLRAKDIAKERGIDRSGYKLSINVERGGGQYIFHLHLHLLGGW